MKKIALICLCTMTALSLLTGCSGSTEGGKENLGTVELGEYKGVKVNMPEVLVTDAEVDSRINQVLSQNPKEDEVDRPAAATHPNGSWRVRPNQDRKSVV